MAARMHANEIDVDVALVTSLVARQFPSWRDLPVAFLARGTVNAMYRLGDRMVVRLPFVPEGGAGIRFESAWLPRLAADAAVPVPRILGRGEPEAGYPCPWLVLTWLPGTTPVPGSVGEPDLLAADLAGFLRGLRQVDPTGAPPGYRTGPLEALDAAVRDHADQAADLVDVRRLLRLWEDARTAEPWAGPPAWTHGDLLSGNILVEGGRLSGVLDFACAGVGDPSCDLLAAWSILPRPGRYLFRDALDIDDDQWRRGRGWAIAQAVIALPYYRNTNPLMAEGSLHILHELELTL